jgi:hypothetical protein
VITHLMEAGNDFNHGKFMLCQLEVKELAAHSALPGYEDKLFFQLGGSRKFNGRNFFVIDMQTGEGAAFSLRPHSDTPTGAAGAAKFELNKHKIWVCPMFEPFLCWLFAQDIAVGTDITKLPRYVHLDAEASMLGYRRSGPDDEHLPRTL